jgi:uncharacterized membrane-anchored protein
MKLKMALLASVLALQTAWILGTSYTRERTLAEGARVMLETRPVDPRDLIRGDFVILNYKISDLSLELFSPPLQAPPLPGTVVHVALERRGEFYEAASASTAKIMTDPGKITLEGRVRPRWFNPNDTMVHVEYGLERFYVREGTGNPRGKLTAQIAVAPSGKAQIRQVFVDGKPYAEAMRGTRQGL